MNVNGKFEEEAITMCKAIKKLAENESALFNFECYLSHHFGAWLEQYANTPGNIASEFEHFSNIE